MFKCEIQAAYTHSVFKATKILVGKSKIGNIKGEHPLRSYPDVYIDGIEKDIRKGDLIRCDGLPYMSRPQSRNVYTKRDSNGNLIRTGRHTIPEGYRPFQLDSGYWVLRKK